MDIKFELRTCKYKPYKVVDAVNALFHSWTREGHAIIEFEDGTITTVEPNHITFTDNKFKEYCF